MRIGIDEVLIYPRSMGLSNRDAAIIPELLKRIGSREEKIILYFSKYLDDKSIDKFIGSRNNTKIIKTPLPSFPTYKRTLKGLHYWPRQAKKDQLNLFHAQYYPTPRLDIPVILTVHDLRFLHMFKANRLPRYIYHKIVVPYSILQADRIIAVSHFTKKDLLEHFKIPEEKIDVIYNPLPPHFKVAPDKNLLSQVREKYRLPESYLLYVGNLEPRKNLGRLIEAYLILRKKLESNLVIVGTPEWQYAKLFDLVREKHLDREIIFTGYVPDEDLPSLYSLARMFVFPSLFEGFGIPVIEAMACGTPVVTSNVSSLPEVAGDAGILVDPYDAESIAEGISRVLTDSKLKRELIKKGYERIKAFDAGQIAGQVLNTYKKVLSNHSA